MIVLFNSDYATTMAGFTANYTSNGGNGCSGTTNLNSLSGTFTDGSGSADYCANLDCKWLIQPNSAATVTLNFSAFDVEPADGNEIYDLSRSLTVPMRRLRLWVFFMEMHYLRH
ncbi:CUB domain-containing protein [Flavobacterium sp. 3HN19-14]|uniref:CUB domain-containing protein n=1 Tax=Flavobacterium sp. 3HN19-14 TaxID=3448133 RepID=UPI003EDFAF36